MKFLTTATVKDVFFTIPQTEQKRLWEENVRWTADFQKNRRGKGNLYLVVGWGRMVGITEANSFEEYAQNLQSPMAQAGFIKYESYPLVEVDEKALDAWLESIKKAG